MIRHALMLTAASLLSFPAAAQSPSDVQGFAPVTVSAANYRAMPRSELGQQIVARSAINPEEPQLRPLAEPRYFVFFPGEIYESDVRYEDICEYLTVALARKGYLNAADSQGIIRDPKKISLILRVSYGVRPWRLPTVRKDNLSWRDGLTPRPNDVRGLQRLGGETVWDSRAGGNDDAYAAAGANEANPNSFWGSGGSAAPAGQSGTVANPISPGANALTGFEVTRDFNLIVLDAFDQAELSAKGKGATRLWTTFVSAPVQRGQSFASMLEAMIRNATPFFGETTSGMQVFTDVRASVKIGELRVMEDKPDPAVTR